MRFLPCAAGAHFLEIHRLGLQAAPHILVGRLVHVLDVVAVRLLHACELPFGNDLALRAVNASHRTFQDGAFTAVGVLHALPVCDFPVIVRRGATLAYYAAEVSSLACVELPVGLAFHFLSPVGDSHAAVVSGG